MKILFAGTPEIAANTLKVLATDSRFAHFEVAGVLTREDAPVGRKRVMTQSPVAELAEALGIPVIKANRIDAATEYAVATLNCDLAVVIAYGVLLKQATLDLMPRGWFNLHYSVLPAYRGAAPVQRALMAGERVTGVTLFKLDAGMDSGPILNGVETEIQPGETAGELLARLGALGHTLLAESLPAIASGTAQLHEQDPSTATFAPKLNRADGELNPYKTASELEYRVRACNPEPMAYLSDGETTLRVLEARALSDSDLSTAVDADQVPLGQVVAAGDLVLVRCADGFLRLLEVQPAGKNRMNAADWLRGAKQPIFFGAQLD